MNEKTEIAVFGGGCFWCTDAVFKILKGIVSVESGYSGGITVNPNYDEVCGGNTGHAECIKIEFESSTISYIDLLTIFFGSHDPTTVNRQGNDVGTQYRSVVFYTTLLQKEIATKLIQDLNSSSSYGKHIVTEILPLGIFYKAESYHKDYFDRNKEAPYCQLVINPKLEKVQEKFAKFLKNHSQNK